ncbi:MAG: ribosome recycling factor [Chloroflexi bacterium]|nr:MAG: ribosome recycling factor [Chloroflexota bacterium]
MINEVMADAVDRMEKALESLRADLRSIRTGRASPALLERIMVDYYSMPTPLQQLATISVPEAQTLVIRPYSPSDLGAIEKAIAKSDLGLTPNNDGQQIRLTIPALTEERRRELTKTVSRRAEEARVAVRNIRRDAIHDLRELEKESMISEDELHRSQERIQQKTDDYIKHVDEIAQEKDQEIMTL